MEFGKWQIKIKNHDLAHAIPWKYYVQGGPCEKQYCCFLHGAREIPGSTNIRYRIWVTSTALKPTKTSYRGSTAKEVIF